MCRRKRWNQVLLNRFLLAPSKEVLVKSATENNCASRHFPTLRRGLLCSSFTSGSLFGKFSNPDRVSVVQTDHSMVSENVEYKLFRQSASCLAQVQLHAGGESSHCPSAPALSRRRQWQWPNWPSDSRCRLRVCSSKWTLGVSMTVQPRTGDTVTCFQMDSFLNQIISQAQKEYALRGRSFASEVVLTVAGSLACWHSGGRRPSIDSFLAFEDRTIPLPQPRSAKDF